MYYNIGYRSIGRDESQLQKGFDEGYTQGISLGLLLGQFIAKSNLNQSNLNQSNLNQSNMHPNNKEKLESLKGLLERNPRFNIEEIKVMIQELSQPQ